MGRDWIRVGLTQRVVEAAGYAERRDALDQRWADFVYRCRAHPVLVPNRHPDPVGYAAELGIDAIVLTGGEDVAMLRDRPIEPANPRKFAPERDRTEEALVEASRGRGWAVVGVCRGMQLLNLYHGGRLKPLTGHVGAPHALHAVGPSKQLFPFDTEVNSFHSLGIASEDLGEGLMPLAEAGGWVEAFAHLKLPHFGVMWHPERNGPFSENDVRFFSNALRQVRAPA
jgi:N5-(cytidine 5'-diphosphoramidyl)-L-glutamine hydrolase